MTNLNETFVTVGRNYELRSSVYDATFKAIISGGWAIKSDGNVEAPCGYFAVVEIPEHQGELQEMIDAVEPDQYANELFYVWTGLPSGFYFTIETNSGLIYVYQMPSYKTAMKHFETSLAEFADWGKQD